MFQQYSTLTFFLIKIYLLMCRFFLHGSIWIRSLYLWSLILSIWTKYTGQWWERRWFSLIVLCSVVSYFIVRACGLWTTFQAIPRIKYKSKHILHCSVNFSSIYCGITIELFASTKIYSLFFFLNRDFWYRIFVSTLGNFRSIDRKDYIEM